MTQSLLIIHRDSSGSLVNIPFAYRDGQIQPIIEEIVDYIVGLDLADSVWEGIAADRLGVILDMRVKLRDAVDTVNRQQAAIEKLKALTGLAMAEAAS